MLGSVEEVWELLEQERPQQLLTRATPVVDVGDGSSAGSPAEMWTIRCSRLAAVWSGCCAGGGDCSVSRIGRGALLTVQLGVGVLSVIIPNASERRRSRSRQRGVSGSVGRFSLPR